MKNFFINRLFIVYPLLFAVFPILFLYAYNASETSVNQVWLPMAISALSTLLLWMLLSVTLRSVVKAGLSTVLLLLFFFSYGHVYDLLERWDVFVPKHSVWLPGLVLVWGYCTYFIKISNKDFKNTTNALNIMAVVLIIMNLFNIAAHEIRMVKFTTGDLHTKENHTVSPVESSGRGTLPDIYYIILDEYAHPDTMAEYYNYDNSQFIDNLTDKGFFVASESRTKEGETYRSLATSLNMEYISNTKEKGFVYQKLSNNRVMDFFKSQGYTVVYFGSSYDEGRYTIPADMHFNYYKQDILASEFFTILWDTTMLKPFYNEFTRSYIKNDPRQAVLDTINNLEVIPDMEGPKFVFAHIMCPHHPFVFGPKGEFVDIANRDDYKNEKFYLGQYIYITQRIQKAIDVLLEKSVEPPIIILQSDHGIRPWLSDIGEHEWQKILNAYYLPGDGSDVLWDSISPVNSFRLIFNQYFGTNYEWLRD